MPSTNAHQILLVEDDDMARVSLAHVLRRAGYKVEAVADGEQAIGLLDAPGQGSDFDVVLTDLLLLEVDGIAVLQRARGLPEPPEVILLTGFGTLKTAIESLRAGAFDYLLKPCQPDELLGCVERAVQRRQASREKSAAIRRIADGLARLQSDRGWKAAEEPPHPAAEPTLDEPGVVRIGELSINYAQARAWFTGRPLDLTPIEYAMLRCLAEAQGNMLSYSEIAQLVYGQQMEADEAHRLLKTHIHNLRYKLTPEYILNVRRAGYRLVAPGG
jgi:DNA-binding response OmpR family regulator